MDTVERIRAEIGPAPLATTIAFDLRNPDRILFGLCSSGKVALLGRGREEEIGRLLGEIEEIVEQGLMSPGDVDYLLIGGLEEAEMSGEMPRDEMARIRSAFAELTKDAGTPTPEKVTPPAMSEE